MKKILITLLIFLCFHPGSPKEVKSMNDLAINAELVETERDNTRHQIDTDAAPAVDFNRIQSVDPDPVTKLEQIFHRVDSAKKLLHEKGY